MKSQFSFFVAVLFTGMIAAQTQNTKPDYVLLENMAINNIVYGISAKSEEQRFMLKICNVDTCAVSQPYVKTTAPDLLFTDVLARIKSELDTALDPGTFSLDMRKQKGQLILNKLKAHDLQQLEASKTELENVLYTIDTEKDQYSAKIILNKTVPYCVKFSKEQQRALNATLEALGGDLSKLEPDQMSTDSLELLKSYQEQKNDRSNHKKPCMKGTGTLNIIDAKIQFFNNKASSIYIKAELVQGASKEKLIFLNSRFSVPLRYFNNYGSTVSVQTQSRDDIVIDYNDVFDYESDQFFNYSIANSQVSLSNEVPDKTSSKVVQRRFFDFFTGIIYSDVLGLNTDNSNAILNAQAKLLLPLSLINKSEWSITRQFVTSANVALNSSFANDSRFIAIKDDETFSNFDLLTKNNLYGKLQLDLVTYESKGWFLNTSIGYSASFYRTGFRYTQTENTGTDIITERQLLSVGHGPYLNFEIRPQTNFGADVFISLEDLNYNDIRSINGRNFKNDIIVDNTKSHFMAQYNMINIEANFYWLTNPQKSKGGVYAKLGSYYHTDSKTIFPQIMVGYATNLTSFVNRFKPKTEVPATKN